MPPSSVRPPECARCGAGRTISFNWQYAKTAVVPGLIRDLSVFVEPKTLRSGTLFKCGFCGQPWYLWGSPEFMNVVPRDRVALIERWNEKPLVLSAEHRSQLAAIGATPADAYGNGSEFQETPCAVITLDGERIDTAIVSVQRHAPFEEHRPYRLASEITQLSPSPFALPLKVRVECSRAEEIRMGLSPTLVTLADGSVIGLNGMHNFFVRTDCKAGDVAVYRGAFDWNKPPPFHKGDEKIVYFAADPAAL